MKEYPSISRDCRYGVPIYLFDKLDGSLIRAEWSRKRGFYKFGRRNGLLDDSNPILKRSVPLFEAKYAEPLSRLFRDARWMDGVAFMEFWGPTSFAGNHAETDTQDVTLFDVVHDKKGFLEPRDFLKMFDCVDHAKLLYQGNFTHPLEDQIKAEGMTFEGGVAKGSFESPGRPLMFKAKSQAWLDRLRPLCKDEAEFERLR